jgi:hypothetical protein
MVERRAPLPTGHPAQREPDAPLRDARDAAAAVIARLVYLACQGDERRAARPAADRPGSG